MLDVERWAELRREHFVRGVSINVAKHWTYPPRPARTTSPRMRGARADREAARENTGWGYVSIVGELCKLGIGRSAGSLPSSQKRGSVRGDRGRGRWRVGWWSEALDLSLECLAAHDVLRFGEVAEDVKVLQAL